MHKILRISLLLLYSLTTILILLISSPLFGQESGTLYPWETTSGNVWKSFGDVLFQPQYKGEISNGKPHGVGILYNGYPTWNKNNLVYLFSERSRYIGEWEKGKINGRGTFTHFDGSKKIGIFKKGRDWNTIWYGSLGDTIKTFSKGKILLLKKYKGVLFCQLSGGVFAWFKNRNNFTDGKYEGDIENGKPNGLGKIIFKTGDNYDGNWVDGKLSGHGTYKSYDGTKYLGEWMNGKYHGKGTLSFSDGLKKLGEFKDGVDWNTQWHDSNGNVIGLYENGIRQK